MILQSYIGLMNLFCLTILVASWAFLITKNPVYSLLALITIFFNAILILLTLNVEFLALTFLIIYVGAIAILFLFVIMMFNLKTLQIKDPYSIPGFWSTAFAYLLIVPKVYSLCCEYIIKFLTSFAIPTPDTWNQFTTTELLYTVKYKTNDILIFAEFFYNHECFSLILIGMLLLTAMLGSIILTYSTKLATSMKA